MTRFTFFPLAFLHGWCLCRKKRNPFKKSLRGSSSVWARHLILPSRGKPHGWPVDCEKNPQSLCVVKDALVDMVFLKRTVDKVKTKVKSGKHLACHLGSRTLNATFERSKSKGVYRVTFEHPVVFDSSMRLIPTRRGRVLGFGKKIEQ